MVSCYDDINILLEEITKSARLQSLLKRSGYTIHGKIVSKNSESIRLGVSDVASIAKHPGPRILAVSYHCCVISENSHDQTVSDMEKVLLEKQKCDRRAASFIHTRLTRLIALLRTVKPSQEYLIYEDRNGSLGRCSGARRGREKFCCFSWEEAFKRVEDIRNIDEVRELCSLMLASSEGLFFGLESKFYSHLQEIIHARYKYPLINEAITEAHDMLIVGQVHTR